MGLAWRARRQAVTTVFEFTALQLVGSAMAVLSSGILIGSAIGYYAARRDS